MMSSMILRVVWGATKGPCKLQPRLNYMFVESLFHYQCNSLFFSRLVTLKEFVERTSLEGATFCSKINKEQEDSIHRGEGDLAIVVNEKVF